MSAASLATSTAPSTEMPTSAAWSDGRVVDAVAEEADDVPAALERQDDAVLLRGRHAAEEGRAPRPRASSAGRPCSSISAPVSTPSTGRPSCRADVLG